MPFFPDHFEQWEISSRSVWNRKISWFKQFFFFAYQPCSNCTFLLYTTKFRLTHRVTAVHLFQYKTIFFIHLRFWGRNLLQIKEHLSWEASINIKMFFDSLTLVYTCLHSSSDSSTLVYIRRHSSGNSSVFLEQIIFMIINHTISFKRTRLVFAHFWRIYLIDEKKANNFQIAKVQPQGVAKLFLDFLPISTWCCL